MLLRLLTRVSANGSVSFFSEFCTIAVSSLLAAATGALSQFGASEAIASIWNGVDSKKADSNYWYWLWFNDLGGHQAFSRLSDEDGRLLEQVRLRLESHSSVVLVILDEDDV